MLSSCARVDRRRQQPHELHAETAYDLLATGFGPGFNGPLLIVAELPTGVPDRCWPPWRGALRPTRTWPYVQATVTAPADSRAVIRVIPKTSPQDKATEDLVHRLRNDVMPRRQAGSSAQAYVGGQTAAFIDIRDRVARTAPVVHRRR